MPNRKYIGILNYESSLGSKRGGRCRGVILDPRGKLEAGFTWGLGESMNNQVEAYALIQGLFFEIELDLKNLIVIDNSSMIIKLMLYQSPSFDNKIASITDHSQKEVDDFQNILFYQAFKNITTKEIF
jgi:ribonuclease HI